MHKRAVAGLVTVLLAGAGAPAGADDEGTWTPLFNGQDLDGWIPKIRGYETGENFGNTFRVEDGLMTVSYDQYDTFDNRFGHIFYETPYSHYRLRVEYRFIGDHAPGTESWGWRNSGVMLHSQSPQSMQKGQDFPISLEAQFLGGLEEGVARPTANLCTPGTHVYYQGHFEDEHCINSTSDTFYGDQWVTVEVLVEGSAHFVHYVNGTPVMEYTDAMTGGGAVADFETALKPERKPLGKGYISLQSEGHPIQFRRVEIQVLDGNDSSPD